MTTNGHEAYLRRLIAGLLLLHVLTLGALFYLAHERLKAPPTHSISFPVLPRNSAKN